MATKSIGATGRDYATPALWASYLDGLDVLSAPEVGECYNDAEFTFSTPSASLCHLIGFTTSSTNTVTLRCAAGQSFKDHADKATNPLRYDQTKGVGMKSTGNYAQVISSNLNYIKLEGLQGKQTNSGTGGAGFALSDESTLTTGTDINQCIIEGGGSFGVVLLASDGKIRNSVCIGGATRNLYLNYQNSGGGAYNCTVVRYSDGASAPEAVRRRYGSPAVKNCAVFGPWTTFFSAGSYDADSGFNCTSDSSAPGTNNVVSKNFDDQFVVTTASGSDFRLKAGADCINAATSDSTNGANDIIGTARPSGAFYDIGAWEFVASSSVSGPPLLGQLIFVMP